MLGGSYVLRGTLSYPRWHLEVYLWVNFEIQYASRLVPLLVNSCGLYRSAGHKERGQFMHLGLSLNKPSAKSTSSLL
jgi:hypothetical protein